MTNPFLVLRDLARRTAEAVELYKAAVARNEQATQRAMKARRDESESSENLRHAARQVANRLAADRDK